VHVVVFAVLVEQALEIHVQPLQLPNLANLKINTVREKMKRQDFRGGAYDVFREARIHLRSFCS